MISRTESTGKPHPFIRPHPLIFTVITRDAAADEVTFDLVVSERLGRTNSREQYAYMFRTDSVALSMPYQFNDSAADLFEREPFAVLVQSLELGECN